MDFMTLLKELGPNAIFCALFIYTYWDNNNVSKEREERYIDTINSFTKSIDDLKEVIKSNEK